MSVSHWINRNAVCCCPVGLSPEAWLRPDGDSVVGSATLMSAGSR